jgi:aspartate carbamoyltransferase catalytic subunit
MSSQVADGSRSVILQQVSNGIAVRMAVIAMALGGSEGRGNDGREREQ